MSERQAWPWPACRAEEEASSRGAQMAQDWGGQGLRQGTGLDILVPAQPGAVRGDPGSLHLLTCEDCHGSQRGQCRFQLSEQHCWLGTWWPAPEPMSWWSLKVGLNSQPGFSGMSLGQCLPPQGAGAGKCSLCLQDAPGAPWPALLGTPSTVPQSCRGLPECTWTSQAPWRPAGSCDCTGCWEAPLARGWAELV